MPQKKKSFDSVLGEIETQLKRQNSLSFSFLQGLMRGLGTALGATVLVALVTSITIQFTDAGQVSAFMQSVISALVAN
jgi:hypothetical protein